LTKKGLARGPAPFSLCDGTKAHVAPFRRMTRTFRHFALAAIILAAASAPAARADTEQPFAVQKVADFSFPWRIAFLPDGDMLVTEKPGKLWLVSQSGEKRPVAGIPPVAYEGQNGLLGVYVAPGFARNHQVYLTYDEPGGHGSGLALARGRLMDDRLDGFTVLWREFPKGKGGQSGGAVAFSRDGRFLFLSVGDRQRMTPAQDPDLPQGKLLRLTLDGRPAPGNPGAGRTGAAMVPLIDPPKNTEAARTAPVVQQLKWPGPNLTPAETWVSGLRTPYGLAFAPDGRLWELEDGPRGGDELNRIEPGRNYGWPLVSWGMNYDGTPIPKPDTRPDLTPPVVQWTPVIAPGSLLFYSGRMFPAWRGSALASGLMSQGIDRVTFDGKGGAQAVARYRLGFRVRDIAEAPDGALWVVADSDPGGLYRLTPR
jgi:aldose sugar dehydrogenase